MLLDLPGLAGLISSPKRPDKSGFYCIILMDDVHLLTARHFRYEYELRGGKIFSRKFGAREVCIAPQCIILKLKAT